jgi:hypothetical protein
VRARILFIEQREKKVSVPTRPAGQKDDPPGGRRQYICSALFSYKPPGDPGKSGPKEDDTEIRKEWEEILPAAPRAIPTRASHPPLPSIDMSRQRKKRKKLANHSSARPGKCRINTVVINGRVHQLGMRRIRRSYNLTITT